MKPDATRARTYAGGNMAEGKRAEALVKRWFQEQAWVVSVEDVSENANWQACEVDLLVHGQHATRKVEVKSDVYMGMSGNVTYELLRVYHTALPQHATALGWSARSEADELWIFSPPLHRLYCVSFPVYRAAFQNYASHARDRINMRWISTDAIKSTLVVLIPQAYIEFQEYEA